MCERSLGQSSPTSCDDSPSRCRIHDSCVRFVRTDQFWDTRLGKLSGEHVDFLDAGRLREEPRSLSHKRSGNLSREMSLTACFVGTGAKNAAAGRSQTNAEPCSRARLLACPCLAP